MNVLEKVLANAFFIVAWLILSLSACTPAIDQKAMVHQAVKIESSDECHLCGMIISQFKGPKGELYKKEVTQNRSNQVKKFCSTRDLFSFYLDPENQRNITTILVHDMSKMPWQQTNDNHFIDARVAWFVAGSSQYGAMGETLASFSQKQDAQVFVQEFGGEVLSFSQIDLAALMQETFITE